MKTLKNLLPILICVLVIASCKKENKEEETPPPATNYLCTGNGTNSYFPLKIGNKWTYVQQGSPNTVDEVKQTVVVNGLTYFEIKRTQSSLSGTYKRRIDSSGNVYELASDNTEYLYLPANPTVNQDLTTIYTGSRKVVSITASTNTTKCNYTGLVKIEYYDGFGSLNHTEYYKKGLGLVQSITFSPMNLFSVTLK